MTHASTPTLGTIHPRGRGFTLIELLVTIGIIAVLLSILVPALGHARECTLYTGELSSARQFATAHRMYSNDNRQFVMPGFASQSMVEDYKVKARFLDGSLLNGNASWQDVARYPWRLLPYFEFNAPAMFRDYEETSNAFGDPTSIVHQTAIAPRMGLNQAFIGGSADTDGTGFAFLDNPNNAQAIRNAWGSRWYVRRITDARRSSDLILFATAEQPNTINANQLVDGFYKILPPYFMERRWTTDPPDSNTTPQEVGYVSYEYLNKATAAMMDGHAEGLTWQEMQDMRRWSPTASSADETLPRP